MFFVLSYFVEELGCRESTEFLKFRDEVLLERHAVPDVVLFISFLRCAVVKWSCNPSVSELSEVKKNAL